MVKARWFPSIRFVTFCATNVQVTMYVVTGCSMARIAVRAHFSSQQSMSETLAVALSKFRACVVTMAGHAVLLGQLLMKRHLHLACAVT
jgi:hypothetical protein